MVSYFPTQRNKQYFPLYFFIVLKCLPAPLYSDEWTLAYWLVKELIVHYVVMPFFKQCMWLRWIKCDFMAKGSTWMVRFLKSPGEVFPDIPQKWRELSCSPWTMHPFPAGGRGNQHGHVLFMKLFKGLHGLCSPIMVYIIPFVLWGPVCIVQMNNWSSGRISDFPKSHE